MRATFALWVLGTLMFLLSGCGRPSVTFALGADNGNLCEKTVIDGRGTAKVAEIDVRGLIVDSPRSGWLGDSSNPVDDLVARLEKASKDPQVRAVLLRINSPGGGVAASETMYREVRRFRETTGKPVVVSMSEVAASGGYYLSLAGDESFAQPTTITGSIGVIMPTFNFSGAMNRWGIMSRSIKSADNKDLANPFEPIRDSQYAVLQGLVDEFYGEFKSVVVARRGNRGLDMSRLPELTDGRVVTGVEAVKAGLVDHEGGLREAFERAKQLAGAQGASLIKYHSETVGAPRSAYAAAENPSPRESGSGDINLLKLDVGESMLGLPRAGGGFYYLWAPGLP
jgi:protease-4